ncbi:T5orf172 domain-containing protein [Deinococcus hopiensis KR-140]|uniref:T5orf172 domain-containing protein n=2 Tax=Deinococcus TaxID=1298 RepID=A0A1W1UJQ9_9DEIO|nr:T5orf172 domain-containing protein [Deinococcus hopiensis KR-140]
MDGGYIYILTNPSLPSLVKIGLTNRDPFRRAAELSSTGVPTPFQVSAALRVDHPRLIEGKMHHAFRSSRVQERREFFRAEPLDVFKTLVEIVESNQPLLQESAEGPLSGPDSLLTIDVRPYYLLTRKTESSVDDRLAVVEGQDFLSELSERLHRSDPIALANLITFEASGSPGANKILLDAILAESIQGDLIGLIWLIFIHHPERLSDLLARFPQHGVLVASTLLESIEPNTKDYRLDSSNWRSPFHSLIYSYDLIMAGYLEAEVFARQLGRNISLYDRLTSEMNRWFPRIWNDAARNDPTTRIRIETLRELILGLRG